MHRCHQLVGEFFGNGGNFHAHDFPFEIDIRIIDIEVQTPPFQGIAHVPVVVGCEHGKRNVQGLAGTYFRNGYLEVAQYFQQKGFKFRIRLVHLVHQQNHRRFRGYGLQQRTGLDKTFGKKGVLLGCDAVGRLTECRGIIDEGVNFFLHDLCIEQLLGILPLVQRLGLIQAFVALQADQLPLKACGHGLGQLCLAHAGRTFHQNGLGRGAGQIDHRGDFIGTDILSAFKGRFYVCRIFELHDISLLSLVIQAKSERFKCETLRDCLFIYSAVCKRRVFFCFYASLRIIAIFKQKKSCLHRIFSC